MPVFCAATRTVSAANAVAGEQARSRQQAGCETSEASWIDDRASAARCAGPRHDAAAIRCPELGMSRGRLECVPQRRIVSLAHIPAKWTPVRRQGHAPLNRFAGVGFGSDHDGKHSEAARAPVSPCSWSLQASPAPTRSTTIRRGAGRLRIRLHEGERRDAPGARAVLLLDRRHRVDPAVRSLRARRDAAEPGQIPGERGGTFRTAEPSKAALNELRRAQAEAEVRCF